MRKAFVGLSSPLCYDYRNQASIAPSDLSDSPNPILDSPFGLILLFDEIWFLCRSLCPENMRSLSYVRFIDEAGLLPPISDLDWEKLSEIAESQLVSSHRVNHLLKYPEAVARLPIWWDAAADNHTHSIRIGSHNAMANSDVKNLAFDMAVLERMNDPSMELVTNSHLDPVLAPVRTRFEARLTEMLILDGIPNYLGPQGPYHPAIEEVRENAYLKDFRVWVRAQRRSTSEAEIRDVKNAVESVLRRAQDEVFLKYLDQKGMFGSVGKSLVGDLAGVLFPGAGAAIALLDAGVKLHERADQRWQGFLVSTRHIRSSVSVTR